MNTILRRFLGLLAVAVVPLLSGCDGKLAGATSEGNGGALGPVVGEEKAVLSNAPNVPPPITRREPTKLIVDLTVIEKEMPIADG